MRQLKRQTFKMVKDRRRVRHETYLLTQGAVLRKSQSTRERQDEFWDEVDNKFYNSKMEQFSRIIRLIIPSMRCHNLCLSVQQSFIDTILHRYNRRFVHEQNRLMKSFELLHQVQIKKDQWPLFWSYTLLYNCEGFYDIHMSYNIRVGWYRDCKCQCSLQ